MKVEYFQKLICAPLSMPRDLAMPLLALVSPTQKVVIYILHASTSKRHTFTTMSHTKTIEGMCSAPTFSYDCYAKMKDTTYVSSIKRGTPLFFVTYTVKIFILNHYATLAILLSHRKDHKVVASFMFKYNSIYTMFIYMIQLRVCKYHSYLYYMPIYLCTNLMFVKVIRR